MAKQEKKYVITNTPTGLKGMPHPSPAMTLAEAIDYYSYTLECGASWQHEKGNKKINQRPTTIKSLITNLNNASSNCARNGLGRTFTAVEVA